MLRRGVLLVLAAAAAPPAYARCIDGRDIAYTAAPNDYTVEFHMRDRTVWVNRLPVRCANLSTQTEGFSFEPTDPATDELCDGEVVLHMSQQGRAACIIGNFSKAPAPHRAG